MPRGAPPARARAVDRVATALGEPGCPVCRCVDADARRDLAAFLREQTMDPAGRAALRAVGGFCAWHTGLLREAADGILSVAIIAEDLVAGARAARGACPACDALRDRADDYVRALLDPAVRGGLETGPGLPCRPHLRRARTLSADEARRGALARALAPRLSRLQADLAGFIAKQDYRASAPPSASEAQALGDALEHLAGRAGLFGSDLARG